MVMVLIFWRFSYVVQIRVRFLTYIQHLYFILITVIEEGILEVKTVCYAKDKVKSLSCFRSFYNDF